ncbi:hypothetical protein SASPL_149322 [Salvia splendens]|uniref:Protein kinase domain-containing protein n=1 Tax=Salvia splendens TaxID=180675 RepID=A0A8X8WBI0_SALSN|nr:hypothetical protein SASPL_149322 [Salvia splendens]
MSTTLLLLFILTTLAHFSHANPPCPPSSCGVIRNISYPFLLKGDPSNCGHHILTCHHNLTSISLNSRNFYVKAIDYQISTIRVADASLNNHNICSFPISSTYYFSDDSHYSYSIPSYSTYPFDYKATRINLMSCPNPMKNPSLFTNISTKCSRMNDRSYSYIKVGHMNASEKSTTLSCMDLNSPSATTADHGLLPSGRIISLATPLAMFAVVLHPALLLILGLLCAVISPPIFILFGIAALSTALLHPFLLEYGIITPARYNILADYGQGLELVIVLIILLPRFILFPVAMWLLIKKFRIRHRDKTISLSWDTKFEIAVGVARGIEYLHRGCDVQILHFDIKPHNILLDDDFIPKISDFGLAKFFSTDKTTVTMTAARGTIGYVAPELISRSIGAVSYKADVYSFGMLLMEMVSLKKDLIGNNDNSSQYFPNWIYDYFNQGKDIEVVNSGDDENYDDSWRKYGRKMTIVALWCIQMCPDHRPSMNKVLEMLEGDVERLKVPNYPSQSTQIVVDQTCSTDSVSLLEHEDASTSVEIIVE